MCTLNNRAVSLKHVATSDMRKLTWFKQPVWFKQPEVELVENFMGVEGQ